MGFEVVTPSESARVTTPSESGFRITPGASVTRRVTVVALDPAMDRLITRLAGRTWTGVTFVPRSRLDAVESDGIASADLVVMVVGAGSDAGAIARIGRACSDRRTHTATFVIRPSDATDEALSRTLVQVRPWSLMVVVASDEDYVEDVLRSFR